MYMNVFRRACEVSLLVGVIVICGMSLALLDDVCKDVDRLSSQVKYLEAKLNE